ncbi:MAG: hypothetical protein LC731_02810 [Acidobacteria bacterium]|nr:hypothetical protein [Acidobacteriota bacterium]
MRRLIFIAVVVVFAASVSADQNYNLPELHSIKTATLAPCYSCRSTEEFQKGYQSTALFLSDYSKQHNSPDLLFNGSRGGSRDYFEASTAGDDMALIADLGADVNLEKVSAHSAFNARNMHSFPDYTKFARVAGVEKNHTYVVLLNKRDIRGLFIFSVVNHVPNERVDLKYAVKEYQILYVKASSPGFDWGKENY